jgi:hypothetical protein
VSSPARPDLRQFAPSTARNRDPILEVLRRVLPGSSTSGTVLEVASGAGEHAAYFAPHFPHLTWQPTEIDPALLASISAWREQSGATNLQAPLLLDTTWDEWPVAGACAVLNVNMIHRSPFSACEGLVRGAGRCLAEGGVLFLYGPFSIDGIHTAQSNVEFDRWLKDRDPSHGVRDLTTVSELAAGHGLLLEQRIEMPANNFSVIFRRSARS